MHAAEIESELLKLIAKRRNLSSITTEDRLRDLAIDSIVFVRLVIDIERVFGIRFADDMLTIQIFQTVGDLSRYVQTLAGENSSRTHAQN